LDNELIALANWGKQHAGCIEERHAVAGRISSRS
jgi:hypothetical protein